MSGNMIMLVINEHFTFFNYFLPDLVFLKKKTYNTNVQYMRSYTKEEETGHYLNIFR